MDEYLSIIFESWFGEYVWAFVGAMSIFAVLLFLVRRSARWLFGIVEIAAGLALLYLAFKLVPGQFSKDFSNDFDIGSVTVTFTAIVGGLSAVIRGLDSIDTW